MDQQDHTKLLRLQSAELTAKTAFCPDDGVIAEYFDGDLTQHECETLERHLGDCRFCLARIGVLERLAENHNDKRIPGSVLAAAKQLPATRPARRPAMAPAWAAAAVVVFSFFIIINSKQVSGPEPGSDAAEQVTGGDTRQMRNIPRPSNSIKVITPLAGAGMSPGSMVDWDDVPGSLHYNIFVLSAAGDVLWTERLKETGWTLDESLSLESGDQYYLRVEALMPDGRSIRSKHIAFQATEQE